MVPDDDDPDVRRRRSTAEAPATSREDLLTAALGHAIKVIRAEQGLGRRELAERAGLSYSYLAEIENGKKAASASAQLAIAGALGLAASNLMADAEVWADRLAAKRADAFGSSEKSASAILALEMPGPHQDAPARFGARMRQLRWMRSDLAEQPRIDNDFEEFQRALGIAIRTTSHRDLDPLAQSADTLADARLDTAQEQNLHAATVELLEILGGLGQEDRERVLDLARRLAGR